ncbi:uncharacterized protein LOC120346019 [Styela clava]
MCVLIYWIFIFLDLVEIQEMNEKLVEENNKMKRDLIKVQEMNEELRDDNEKMEKAISRIEQRLAVMEKSQKLPNRSGQINRPTTKTRGTLKPTPPPENCKLKIGNICYFAVIYHKQNVKYDKAVDICKKRNANVGLIRDEESYNAIMNYLRKNIPTKRTWVYISTGINFDPMTGDVTPADSFIKWSRDGIPFTGIDFEDRTNVYLDVNFKPSYHDHGMANAAPTWERNGVIWEILI